MFRKLVDKILGEDPGNNTIAGWIAGFTVIVLLRSFLEVFSNTPPSGVIVSEAQRVHYFLFYIATTLLVVLAVAIFTKQKNNRVINLALYGLPVILIAPIIDLIANTWNIVSMDYIFNTHTKLLLDFLTFFGPLHSNGITFGMRVEVFIILCLIGWYVWMKNKSVMSVVSATVVSYLFIFIMLSLPGIIYTLSHLSQIGAPTSSIYNFTEKALSESNILTNILHSSLSYNSEARLVTLVFCSIISQVLFIFSFIAGLLLFWYTSRDTMKRVLSNARLERVLFYLSLITLGALYAYTKFSVATTWINWLGFLVIALSWFSAWMFAVHTNDIADIEIDVISNPSRPLPQKTLSVETMRDVGFMWLVLSLVGSYVVGYYVFFMNIIFTSAYYLYSAQPLRLKQVPIFSSFLISVACLSTILAGFFFVSPNKMIEAFPLMFAIGILVVFTLGVNIRDIKDIAGDRALGILTLPVIFGRHGRNVVGVLLALSFLLAPIFFSPYVTFFTAVPSAVVGYWLCTKQNYNEKYIFLLFFIFLLASILFKILTI